MDQGFTAVIGAVIGLVGGFVIAGLNYRQKADELFFKALDFLQGGTQQRNLGISAIELYWSKRRHRGVCASLLSGSAIYLLRESEQGAAAHELHNLYRIMAMLLSVKKIAKSQKSSYSYLQEAVKEALKEAQNRTSTSRGLIVDQTKLSTWEKKLDNLLKQMGKTAA